MRLGERTCVVKVATALDAGAAEHLEERVDTAMADGCRDFVLDLTAVDGCCDRRPIAALSRLAHRLAGEDCEVVVAACHVDLLTFLDSVPTLGTRGLSDAVSGRSSSLATSPSRKNSACVGVLPFGGGMKTRTWCTSPRYRNV
jgi:hypothetical protein